MKYLMLVCRDRTDSPHPPSEADREGAPDVEQWWQAANDGGNYVMGDPLRPAEEARTVRVRDGKVMVTEGPFTETSELVVGFDILECASMEEAVRIASGHSMAHGGAIELREFWPFDEKH